METARLFANRYYELINAGDLERLSMLYSDDGEIIRYDGVADTPAAIADYYRRKIAEHPGLKLRQIDRIRRADDVLMWDALVDSDAGVMQTVEIMFLDEDGRIMRHIPGFRGYWGA